MNDGRDDLLLELRAALDVEPSPDFQARVRQRAVLEPVARHAIWQWFGGLTAAATLVIAVVLAPRDEMPSTMARLTTRADVATTPSAIAAGSIAVSPDVTEAAVTRPASAASAGARARRPAEMLPGVLIDPRQSEALDRLRTEIAFGHVVAPRVNPPNAEIEIAPLSVMAPIALDDIRIEPLSINVFPTLTR